MRHRPAVRGVRAGQHAAGVGAGGGARRRAGAVVRRGPAAGLPAALAPGRALRGGPLPRAGRQLAAAPAGARLPGERLRGRAALGTLASLLYD